MNHNYCMKCMNPVHGIDVCPFCGYAGEKTHAPHVLMPGTILKGRYLLGEPLGQGGFGITYIARDLRLDMRIAVKEYFPNGYANRNVSSSDRITITDERLRMSVSDGKDRFLKEAQTLARFNDEQGIVDVRDYFEENNTAYIVMEYLSGDALSRVLKSRLFTADQIFSLMAPIFDTLEKIHAENVIHRDISPDNIRMLSDGSLKLMDFGAARIANFADEKSLSVVLKPGYAPVEQYSRTGCQGPWTDIYSLCATIYKCITGITPQDSPSRMQKDEIKWPSELNIPIRRSQESVLKQGMSVRIEDRFQSMKALKAALNELPEEQFLLPVTVTPKQLQESASVTILDDALLGPVTVKLSPNMKNGMRYKIPSARLTPSENGAKRILTILLHVQEQIREHVIHLSVTDRQIRSQDTVTLTDDVLVYPVSFHLTPDMKDGTRVEVKDAVLIPAEDGAKQTLTVQLTVKTSPIPIKMIAILAGSLVALAAVIITTVMITKKVSAQTGSDNPRTQYTDGPQAESGNDVGPNKTDNTAGIVSTVPPTATPTPSPVSCMPVTPTPSPVFPTTTTPTPASMTFSIVKTGDIIQFGTYEQNSILSDGKEPIEWRVLKKTGTKMLLITDKIIECMPYHDTNKGVRWNACYLRNWLNSSFLNSAFSEEERSLIMKTAVQDTGNPDYGMGVGKESKDYVFLLSIDEAKHYFKEDSDRRAKATAYVQDNGILSSPSGESSWWWLRSPGDGTNHAAAVYYGGRIYLAGDHVKTHYGVRPAMWVSLKNN